MTASVGHEAFERVVARIHRPHRGVQGPGQMPRPRRDLAHVRLNLFRRPLATLRQFAQQSDLGQARAKVVVNVFRDARAFPFDGTLPLRPFHLKSHPADLHVANDAAQGSQHRNPCQRQKPPCLPEVRQDFDAQRRDSFVPVPVTVGCRHAKPKFPRRQMAVISDPASLRLHPIQLQTLQLESKSYIPGRGKAQRRELDRDLLASSSDLEERALRPMQVDWRLGNSSRLDHPDIIGGHRMPIHGHALDHYLRWRSGANRIRMHHGHSRLHADPQPPIPRAHCPRPGLAARLQRGQPFVPPEHHRTHPRDPSGRLIVEFLLAHMEHTFVPREPKPARAVVQNL